MREPVARGVGLLVVASYAVLIGWLFASQPRSVAEAVGGLSDRLGTYRVDAQAFADGLAFFRRDQFVEARAAFTRADPASRDALTQFYIAYSYYRQGWHRTYHDNELFEQGLAHVERAIGLAPDGRIVVDDGNLSMRSADELKAELQSGLILDAADFNPLRLLRDRK
jgi:tetratricopeptide (TPR) repeat protein